MPKQAIINFSGGEVSSDLYGRVDSSLYQASGKFFQNMIPQIQGSMTYKSGTMYGHNTADNNVARVERFRFNDEQVYVLEFSDSILRIYEDAGLTLNAAGKTISGATVADPVVVTATSHGFSDGDEVYISGVVGMTELNGRFFRVANKTTHTFELTDLYGNDVDGSAFTAYDSAGTATKVYEVVSPYAEADLDAFQMAQDGNVAYLVHRDYAPYKLTRVSSTSWTLATYSRTADPFTGAGDYPGCVTFYEGRAVFASTDNNPNSIFASKSPTAAGASQFDNFTTGSAAGDAIIFPINSSQGDVAYINWLAGTHDFIGCGTTGGIIRLDGGGDSAITPTNLRARPIDPYGAHAISAVANGSTLLYVQKGQRILRSFEYDLLSDSFRSFDRTFLAPHITVGNIKKIAFQRGSTDFVWAVLENGEVIATVLKSKEDVSGWFRVKLGGDATVLDLTVEPIDQGYDRVWFVVERTINGVTVRYMEYLTAVFEGINVEKYYTGDEDADILAYNNETYEAQRNLTYLDSHLVFYGSDIADGSITMTPGAATGTGVTFTASSSIFTSADVGKEIQKKYADRAGGGRALITEYTSGTEVVCSIISDFDSVSAIPAGSWYLTTESVTGVHHLEGETVQVVADGRLHSDVVVTDGVVTLDRQAAIVVIGFSYVGVYRSLDLAYLGAGFNTLSDAKGIGDIDISFAHSVGGKYGTSLYTLEEVYSSVMGQSTDRPPLPATGPSQRTYLSDSWASGKDIFIVQDQPYPFKVVSINSDLDFGVR